MIRLFELLPYILKISSVASGYVYSYWDDVTKCAVLAECLTIIVIDPVERKKTTPTKQNGQKVVWKGPAEIYISKCVSDHKFAKFRENEEEQLYTVSKDTNWS